MRRSLPFLAVAVLLGLTLAPYAGAASIRSLDGGDVAVRAQGVPLGQVLEELGALVPLDVVATDPAFLRRPITAHLERVPLEQAAARILLETDLSFAVGGLKGKPLRVIVGAEGPDALLLLAAAPSAEASDQPSVPASASSVDARAGTRVMRSELRRRAAPLLGRRQSAGMTPSPPAASGGDTPYEPGSHDAGRLTTWRTGVQSRHQFGQVGASEAASAQRAAEQVPQVVAGDADVPGGYMIQGDSVTYNDPNFIPYKNRPEVRARREAADVSTIP